jgi:hypothetical protein
MTDDLEEARIKKKLSELMATTGLIDSHDVAGLFERPHEEILLVIETHAMLFCGAGIRADLSADQ